MRVLVVEDEARIAAFLVKGLEAGGYEVESVATGEAALSRAARPGLDLLILDLGLPDVDGSEVLRRLRDRGTDLPVIILTARGEVDDRVQGLDLGADDYLTKPFAFDELLARVRAHLRRREGTGSTTRSAGGVELDLSARRATVDGRRVELTSREFALLDTFLQHAGEVLSREVLLSSVWGLDFDPGSNVVDVYVRYLRRKLGEDLIETVRGAGYRLVATSGAEASPPGPVETRIPIS